MVDDTKNCGHDIDQSWALYSEWRKTWANPVLNAAYTHKFDQGNKLLAAARENYMQSTLPEDVLEGIAILLIFLDCRLKWDPRAGGYAKEDYDQIISQLSISSKSEFGDYVRIGVLIQFRCNGTSDSYDELTSEEVGELLKDMPPLMSGPAWHHLARWAFEHREFNIMEQAFEHFLLYPTNVMGQAKWQRVNMMYQLLSGKASKRDVEESIKVLEIRPQVEGFKKNIWPECVKLGLTDPGLEKMLADKHAEIMAKDEGPGLERKTKSFFGRNIPG